MNQPEGYVLVQIKQLAQWREWANNVAAWSKQADRSSEVARLKASISSAMISATLPPAIAAGERDAERYRWLRHNGTKFPEPIGCMSEMLCDDDLDSAIDAYLPKLAATPAGVEITADQLEDVCETLRNTYGLQGDVEEIVNVVAQSLRAALATKPQAEQEAAKGVATGPLSSRLRPNMDCERWVIAEVVKLEADAERYRWLRDTNDDWEAFDGRWLSRVGCFGDDGPAMDAAIDAARASNSGGAA